MALLHDAKFFHDIQINLLDSINQMSAFLTEAVQKFFLNPIRYITHVVFSLRLTVDITWLT